MRKGKYVDDGEESLYYDVLSQEDAGYVNKVYWGFSH